VLGVGWVGLFVCWWGFGGGGRGIITIGDDRSEEVKPLYRREERKPVPFQTSSGGDNVKN